MFVLAGKLLSSQREPAQWKTTDSTLGCGMALKATSQTRKALGDLNRASSVGNKMAAPDCLKPPASRCAERQVENDNQLKHSKHVI